MNFDFSDEQKQLREQARRFLSDSAPVSGLRRRLGASARSWDRPLWDQIAGQGWLGAAIPERFGGLGLSYLELCVLAEELGRALAPVPFSSSIYLFAEILLAGASAAQQERFLPKIASGEVIGCLADSEGQANMNGAATAPCIVEAGRLSGRKLPVVDGDCADVAVVSAHERGRKRLYLVELNDNNVTRENLKMIDPTRAGAALNFAAARCVPIEADGDILSSVNERAAILFAFEQVGGADRCLEMAREYALGRFAFGRPIATYQAIKHRLVDIYVKSELARANAYYGAWALNSGAAELPLAAAAARIAASEAYWFAAKENIQIHGGVGFTWEMDCHFHYKRSRHLALVCGSPRIWKQRLAGLLEQRNAA